MLLTGLISSTPDIGWELWGSIILVVALISMGTPVWVSLGIGATSILYFSGSLPISLIGEAVFDGIDSFALIAVPLFILTGDVLVRTGLSDKLLNVAEALTRGILAGFGTATVLGCGFFVCISGSDVAGAAAVGRMTILQGYPKSYASALVASGSCTGILIPPSIAYIILGLVFGLSVSTLFLAAVIPGIMIMLSVIITNLIVNRHRGYERSNEKFSCKYLIDTIIDSRYALLIPFIILGGIYSGLFTPTEAASVSVTTTIIIGLLQKTITIKDFPKMLESSAKINGIILPIIAFSLPLAQALASIQIPEYLVYSITSLTENYYLIILMMLVILIIAGCLVETTPNIVILGPILLPIAQTIGMNEIHFSIFMVTALGVGFITPPLGLNLFVMSSMTKESVLSISKKAVPFMLGMSVVVLLIAYIPQISLVFIN